MDARHGGGRAPGSVRADGTAPVRILHLLSSPVWSGPAEPVGLLAAGQRALGHAVSVAIDSTREGTGSEEPAAPHLAELGLLDRQGLRLCTRDGPGGLWRDARLLGRLEVDVVHAHFSHDHWVAALSGHRGVRVRSFHAARSRRLLRPPAAALHRAHGGAGPGPEAAVDGAAAPRGTRCSGPRRTARHCRPRSGSPPRSWGWCPRSRCRAGMRSRWRRSPGCARGSPRRPWCWSATGSSGPRSGRRRRRSGCRRRCASPGTSAGRRSCSGCRPSTSCGCSASATTGPGVWRCRGGRWARGWSGWTRERSVTGWTRCSLSQRPRRCRRWRSGRNGGASRCRTPGRVAEELLGLYARAGAQA